MHHLTIAAALVVVVGLHIASVVIVATLAVVVATLAIVVATLVVVPHVAALVRRVVRKDVALSFTLTLTLGRGRRLWRGDKDWRRCVDTRRWNWCRNGKGSKHLTHVKRGSGTRNGGRLSWFSFRRRNMVDASKRKFKG